MNYLVDTCVLSECARRRPNPKVKAWLREKGAKNAFYVSVITIGEIAEGIESIPDGDQRKAILSRWFKDDILQTYRDNILSFDREAALICGRIKGETNRLGLVRPDLDAQIAATALVHGMTVVTRNVEDMTHTGVAVVNPFT